MQRLLFFPSGDAGLSGQEWKKEKPERERENRENEGTEKERGEGMCRAEQAVVLHGRKVGSQRNSGEREKIKAEFSGQIFPFSAP